MTWYGILLLFVFCGGWLALLCFLAYQEWKRYKATMKMLDQREKFYFWGTEWFYRECGGSDI